MLKRKLILYDMRNLEFNQRRNYQKKSNTVNHGDKKSEKKKKKKGNTN